MSLRRGDMEKSMMMAAAAAAPFPDDGAGESEQSWMMMSTPAEAASLTMSIDEVSGWVDNPLVMSAVRPAGDDVLPWMTASSSSSSSSPPPLPSSPRFLEVYPHSTKRAEAVDGKPATPDREGCDAKRRRLSRIDELIPLAMADQPHKALLSPQEIVALLDVSPSASLSTGAGGAASAAYPLSPPYHLEPPHCLEMLIYDQELAFERILSDKDKGVPGAEWPLPYLRQRAAAEATVRLSARFEQDIARIEERRRMDSSAAFCSRKSFARRVARIYAAELGLPYVDFWSEDAYASKM